MACRGSNAEEATDKGRAGTSSQENGPNHGAIGVDDGVASADVIGPHSREIWSWVVEGPCIDKEGRDYN